MSSWQLKSSSLAHSRHGCSVQSALSEYVPSFPSLALGRILPGALRHALKSIKTAPEFYQIWSTWRLNRARRFPRVDYTHIKGTTPWTKTHMGATVWSTATKLGMITHQGQTMNTCGWHRHRLSKQTDPSPNFSHRQSVRPGPSTDLPSSWSQPVNDYHGSTSANPINGVVL